MMISLFSECNLWLPQCTYHRAAAYTLWPQCPESDIYWICVFPITMSVQASLTKIPTDLLSTLGFINPANEPD